jgi:hypothetical protein
MLRLAIVLPLWMLALGSCASVPEPESTSVPAVVQAVPATMPDLRAQPVDFEVPSVCTTTNGMCHSLGLKVPEGIGLDLAKTCALLAQRLQLGSGSGFTLWNGDSFQDFAKMGLDGDWRWDATVCPTFQGTPFPQLLGTITAHVDGVRWDLPAVKFLPTGSGLGVLHDADFAKAQRRAHVGGDDDPAWSVEPVLVYARPTDPIRRASMQWPDESQGPIYRPSWWLHPYLLMFVDAATGCVWIEREPC